MFFRLVTEYTDRQGVTEQLKSENQFLWIQKMINILACVREVVENDIIYSQVNDSASAISGSASKLKQRQFEN